jgi:hypothetical protein
MGIHPDRQLRIPLETDEGWIVLTHGVGPMRQYCIGAMLLDLENPSKVIARLDEPLLAPHEKEREGYVPNVVYSCGAIIHNNELVIPYAMSDINSGIATVDTAGDPAVAPGRGGKFSGHRDVRYTCQPAYNGKRSDYPAIQRSTAGLSGRRLRHRLSVYLSVR